MLTPREYLEQVATRVAPERVGEVWQLSQAAAFAEVQAQLAVMGVTVFPLTTNAGGSPSEEPGRIIALNLEL